MFCLLTEINLKNINFKKDDLVKLAEELSVPLKTVEKYFNEFQVKAKHFYLSFQELKLKNQNI